MHNSLVGRRKCVSNLNNHQRINKFKPVSNRDRPQRLSDVLGCYEVQTVRLSNLINRYVGGLVLMPRGLLRNREAVSIGNEKRRQKLDRYLPAKPLVFRRYTRPFRRARRDGSI
jgi:hypothetical protein